MRYLILILLPFIAIFLQSTFFGEYSIKGVIPDLVLVFVVFYALFNDAKKSAVYGFYCGLLEDLYMGRFIGINALAKALTAYLIGRLQVIVFNENIFVGVLSIIVGTIMNTFILVIISTITIQVLNIDQVLFLTLLYQTLYNALLSIPIYIWYYYSSKKGLLSGQ
ncbi:Rod shape-determining protein MreD [Candidatus Syntrophocurvum alkaliphilum]|uniref:Rod shape-determining protein MreD n=1 Tax=Candidatus Syntrophocurvum alkaliphilum TaxID=2293317 RepID=A0A6I6DG06_9FIRM|nr:rod shape-determining protein MreD [Candidatus Syntrophocurvum alkaliphilum]QGU00047.1 Rod shape-determining protein MreD [Candidatus Syntrophocurvum alkaliphilum]